MGWLIGLLLLLCRSLVSFVLRPRIWPAVHLVRKVDPLRQPRGWFLLEGDQFTRCDSESCLWFPWDSQTVSEVSKFCSKIPFLFKVVDQINSRSRGKGRRFFAAGRLKSHVPQRTSRLLHVILTVLNLLIFRRTVYDGESNLLRPSDQVLYSKHLAIDNLRQIKVNLMVICACSRQLAGPTRGSYSLDKCRFGLFRN